MSISTPPPHSPLDWILVHRRVTPSVEIDRTNFCPWVETGTQRIKCFALEPRPLDLKSISSTGFHNDIYQTRNTFNKDFMYWYRDNF